MGFDAHSFNYPTLHATAEQVAEQLAEAVLALAPPVHLVGHSLGGLMVLKLFDLFPDQPPGRVVLMGSPVAGSTVARGVASWPIGPSLLGPLALTELVKAPPRRWAQDRDLGVIAGSMSAGVGRMVSQLPEPNDGTVALVETEISGATDTILLPVTHTGMLFSPTVAQTLARFLGSGRFAIDAAATAST